MFPIGGSVSTPSGGNTGGGGGTTVTSLDYAMPMVRRAYDSSNLGLNSGSLPLIQSATDLNKLYLVNGTSATFMGSSTPGGPEYFTQVLLGNDSLSGVTGTFYVFINKSSQYPVKFRCPMDDAIQYSNGSFTDDFFDTDDRLPGAYMRITRSNTSAMNKPTWLITPIGYTDLTILMNPEVLRTLPT